jgi:hypothetical protein
MSVGMGAMAVAYRPIAGAQVSVEARPVPLSQGDGQQIGALAYRGGLWLISSDPRVGGLSDLWVSSDGTRIVAISDCGDVVSARLTYVSGRLTGICDVSVTPLRGPGGRDLSVEERDAEGLACGGPATCVVSFEHRFRFDRYANDPGPLALWLERIPPPAAMLRLEPNAGVEALAQLGDGRLLAIEEGQTGAHSSSAWLGGQGSWRTLTYPLVRDEASRSPYRPSSATVLPGGDVLVLERRFPPIGCRIRRLSAAALEAGDLRGVEVARWERPMTLDNFEGIASRKGEAGETLVYIVSDDNRCPKVGSLPAGALDQRTLLMMFELQE